MKKESKTTVSKISINFGEDLEQFKNAIIEYARTNKAIDYRIEIKGTYVTIKDTTPIELFHLGMYFERELNKMQMKLEK
jgi:hypothetical protein